MKGHNRILRSLRVRSFGRLGVQHFFHKHSAFDPDFLIHDLEIIAFYGFYGFAACVGLVYVSKLMRGWKEKKFLMRDEIIGRNEMNFLAAATESVSHPATMLVVGLAGRVLKESVVDRNGSRSLAWAFFVIGLEPGSFPRFRSLAWKSSRLRWTNRPAFGYLFHAAALIAGIHFIYATVGKFDGTVVRRFRGGVALQAICSPFFSGGRLSLSLRFSNLGEKDQRVRRIGFSVSFLSCFSGFLFLPKS